MERILETKIFYPDSSNFLTLSSGIRNRSGVQIEIPAKFMVTMLKLGARGHTYPIVTLKLFLGFELAKFVVLSCQVELIRS